MHRDSNSETIFLSFDLDIFIQLLLDVDSRLNLHKFSVDVWPGVVGVMTAGVPEAAAPLQKLPAESQMGATQGKPQHTQTIYRFLLFSTHYLVK